ncbi:uncharacterized protein BT62DRAFT_960024 [Guyanagaster necrorhizus]|uniref:HIT-type domain-containing protein n=1 Tax=Guyanagaster necrorhizus TaxID=856835 RepID=A0A9P7W414_9AGAR|nr:uncharacterized protein BT62DRAFT_960024 [Guyanagaster necrorhizus MCA 3950]KAG7452035.1 hypothetical protein BT62DRAFT_960024 [Guyanagaster necrorhizus MCA 3950]
MSRSARRPLCQICSSNESKYTCSGCHVMYCSVPCYKEHKGAYSRLCFLPNSKVISTDVEEPKLLRSLASLNWPYVPERSAYPDPLQRDDPKPLQLHQYEAIAMSPKIRKVLSDHPNLPVLLTSIDNLRGGNRDLALQRALGVMDPQFVDRTRPVQLEEDVLALRALAEAVEDAVRGEKKDALGLNWGDD